MTNHNGADHIHLTGSDNTYENIVYGKTLTEEEKSMRYLKKLIINHFQANLVMLHLLLYILEIGLIQN